MKTNISKHFHESGNAIFVTLIITATALVTLSGVMAWSSSNARQAARSNQYSRSVAAAEAATEKVGSQLMSDFLNSGQVLVNANLSTYRSTVPNSTDSSYWSGWQFSNPSGTTGSTYVQQTSTSNYVVLSSTYAGLNGYVSAYNIVSDAKEVTDVQSVTGSVFQQLQLTEIPVYQFAMYSSGEIEISCGQPFVINGPVHANGPIYVEPDSLMTFESSVTASGGINFSRDPADSRTGPAGSVVYDVTPVAHAKPLTLPIGTTNSPSAIEQLLQPPPTGESATSALGSLRYYNKADMILVVSNSGITATSGLANNFATTIPTNQVALFATTNNSFYDSRESKTVLPVDIDVGKLTKWSATNTTLRTALGSRDVSSLYVWDKRTLPGTDLAAVRLVDGLQLPSLGLTVVTEMPLYVWGNYNQTNAANLGTSNTTTTLPAQLVGDAITVLSTNWTDANSTAIMDVLGARVASSTTVNAAILAGEVFTSGGNYSGGMENFVRFLEDWSSATFTYNGSMVKMFPSVYATNFWGKANVYSPPSRNWSFDFNFNNPVKLPPLTPGLQLANKFQWATITPGATNVAAVSF
jgi:hypothetical protein